MTDEVAQAAQRAMQIDRPGEYLRKAWGLIYGRNPDPNAGYLQAVMAVEAAAKPVVAPNDKDFTLGRGLGELGKSPRLFGVVSRPGDGTFDPYDTLLGMCRLMWKSQPQRHGAPDPHPLAEVSQEEAEAALHVAVTLVQWFSEGYVFKVAPPTPPPRISPTR